jgi:hypothetical protein
LALTPQSNEAFLREVDEQVRLDTAARFWKRWGKAVIALVVIALAALGGYLWWNSSRQAAAGVEGEKMSVALDDLASGNLRKAEPALKTLSTSKVPGYSVAAKLALADLAQGKGDLKAAAAGYDAIAADTSLAQPYRDLALVRSVAAQYDTLKPETAIARLKPLAVQGNPWFGSAGEMTAIAYLRLNKTREAGAMFAALGRDESAPQSIRSRAVQLAGVLGVETKAPGGATIKPETGGARN